MTVKFSITLLMQSFNESDNSPRNSYEHKVVLHQFDEEISNECIKETILNLNGEEAYTVEGGTKVYWKPIKIIDLFEIDESIVFENNCEVYSRYFIEKNLTPKDIIDKYFSDYVWDNLEIDQ